MLEQKYSEEMITSAYERFTKYPSYCKLLTAAVSSLFKLHQCKKWIQWLNGTIKL